MPLDRLTQITSSGISSNSTITVSAITVSAGSTSAPSISPSGDSNTGIFFPAPDTVAIGEGGSEVIRINSSGNVGLGTINPSARLHSLGDTSSAATYIINRSTAYATGSVTNYYHYVSEQGTFTGGTVYTQYGYYVGNLSGAAYNYGVYSNLSAGSNKWNFYAGGTASNYFAGNVLVGSATSTGTASQPLQVSGGAYISGSVGIGTTNPTRRFEVWAGTAGTSFSVDSSGRVIMPYQPFVSATKTNGNPTGTDTLIVFNTTDVNVGNHYSTATGLFTCPVAGSYRVTIHGHTENSTGNHGLSPLKNGVLQSGGSFSAFGSATYVSHIADVILTCAANDTLSARNRYGTFWGGNTEGVTMTIQLLG